MSDSPNNIKANSGGECHSGGNGEAMVVCNSYNSTTTKTNTIPTSEAKSLCKQDVVNSANFWYPQNKCICPTNTTQSDISGTYGLDGAYQFKCVANNTVSSTIPPSFTSNTLGDGTKLTRITAIIKNGGEGLKYCINTLDTTPCTDLQPVASGGGINWTYTTTDGGTYIIDQDVSSFGFPFLNYQVVLKKKGGDTTINPMVVANITDPSYVGKRIAEMTAQNKLLKETSIQEAEKFPNIPEFVNVRKAGVFDPRNLSLKTFNLNYPLNGGVTDCVKNNTQYGTSCRAEFGLKIYKVIHLVYFKLIQLSNLIYVLVRVIIMELVLFGKYIQIHLTEELL